jgi:hypothetical protein
MLQPNPKKEVVIIMVVVVDIMEDVDTMVEDGMDQRVVILR